MKGIRMWNLAVAAALCCSPMFAQPTACDSFKIVVNKWFLFVVKDKEDFIGHCWLPFSPGEQQVAPTRACLLSLTLPSSDYAKDKLFHEGRGGFSLCSQEFNARPSTSLRYAQGERNSSCQNLGAAPRAPPSFLDSL